MPYTFFITFGCIWNISDFNLNFKTLKFLNLLASKQSPALGSHVDEGLCEFIIEEAFPLAASRLTHTIECPGTPWSETGNLSSWTSCWSGALSPSLWASPLILRPGQPGLRMALLSHAGSYLWAPSQPLRRFKHLMTLFCHRPRDVQRWMDVHLPVLYLSIHWPSASIV